MIRTGVLQELEGRAAWPSLFVLCAALLLLAGSLYTDRAYQWGGIALLALACAPWRTFPANALGAITGLYCAWLLGNALFVTPVYSAESIYRPLILLGAFAAFAAIGRDAAIRLFRPGVILLAGLVLLGLLQHFFGLWRLEHNPTRAAGSFVTPNTFATAINLFLLPLAALYVARGGRGLLLTGLWLFAGLVASESRGGMLAFVAGLAFAAVCIGQAAMWRFRKRVLHLLAGCAVVWLAIASVPHLVALAGPGGAEASLSVGTWHRRDAADRIYIFGATLGLIVDRSFGTAGVNTFFPLFEIVKPEPLRFGEYHFAHNDYLQQLLELGVAGLALLLALVATALIVARRACRRTPADPLPLACGAALATTFAHAMVDFPLYVPFVIMIVGSYLGALAAHVGDSRLPVAAAQLAGRASEALTTRVRWALALAALAWLAQPALADFASHRSIRVLARGNVQDGIYWQSVARRLEPRHPAHYWAEATIWREQAIEAKSPLFAEKADALFVEGMRVNPYDVANLLGRVSLHRHYPHLLKEAAAPAEVLAWAERAAALRPHNLTVQAEYARTLAYAGQPERARTMARALLEQHPASEFARRLAAEL